MEKEIFLLKNKQTDELAVYQLVDDFYIGVFDKNLQKFHYFEGFDLLLTGSFTKKENIDWLINILDFQQYEQKKYNNIIFYTYNDVAYFSFNEKNSLFSLEQKLYLDFTTKISDDYNVFTNLIKNILEKFYNHKVNIIEYNMVMFNYLYLKNGC